MATLQFCTIQLNRALPPFTTGNLSTAPQRVAIAEECLKDMIKWLDEGGQVGIYDASNTTEERRKLLQDILSQKNIQVDYFLGCGVEDGEGWCTGRLLRLQGRVQWIVIVTCRLRSFSL